MGALSDERTGVSPESTRAAGDHSPDPHQRTQPVSRLIPMDNRSSRDPHWDRVVEIAARLWIDGIYVAELDTSQTQRFVDLQWAAHQAGRVLAGRAKIETCRARAPEDPTATITVRFIDPDGEGLRRAEEGLKQLLRRVLEDHQRR